MSQDAPRTTRDSPAKNWVFTIHYRDEEDLPWCPWSQPWTDCTYVVCGLEKCPESGRLHWQGYLSLIKKQRLCSVKSVLGCNFAHLEKSRGTPQEAADYCKKRDSAINYEDGDKILFETGTLPSLGGKKSNRDQAYREVLGSLTFDAALEKWEEVQPREYMLYHESGRRLLQQRFMKNEIKLFPRDTFNRPFIQPERFERKSIFVWGSTGVGKTAWALAHFKKPYLISHIDQLKSFNPLVHDGLVFDDMQFTHWPPGSCIHLVDTEYDRHINARYATAVIPAKYPRIFCSNVELRQYFSDKCMEEQWLAIERRIDVLHVYSTLIK